MKAPFSLIVAAALLPWPEVSPAQTTNTVTNPVVVIPAYAPPENSGISGIGHGASGRSIGEFRSSAGDGWILVTVVTVTTNSDANAAPSPGSPAVTNAAPATNTSKAP